MTHSGSLDARFSEADRPTEWEPVAALLTSAELYWITTVRAGGRPHVAPLVGVWVDDSFVFCTGTEEQKARNLAANAEVVVTTGVNTWKDGLDVVVEGRAERVTGGDVLRKLADAWREKYHGDWDFENDDEVFDPGGTRPQVFRVVPSKIIAFAKSPHGQTTFR